MNTSTILSRQQTVYRLPLPIDVIDVILSYVFYDKATGEARKAHRENISKIVFIFANAIDSRAHGTYHWDGDGNFHWKNPDTDQYWCVVLERDSIIWQAVSCRQCGEYISIHNNNYTPPILCQCIPQLEDEFEEDFESIDENDEDADDFW